MHFTTAVVSTLALASSALAQYASAPAPVSANPANPTPLPPAPPGEVAVQVVKVSDANGTLAFSPNNIMAPVGSMVQFHFYPKNHSIVQAAFSNPCTPINNVQSNVTGFFSGFMPTAATDSSMPVWTLQINNTSPIWFYCSQGDHCQSGMVGAINAVPGSAKNINAFASMAAMASANLSPGQQGTAQSNSTSTAGTPAATGSSPSTGTGSGSGSGSSSAPITTTTAATGAAPRSMEILSSAALVGLSLLVSFAL
jgi:plastocyanin